MLSMQIPVRPVIASLKYPLKNSVLTDFLEEHNLSYADIAQDIIQSLEYPTLSIAYFQCLCEDIKELQSYTTDYDLNLLLDELSRVFTIVRDVASYYRPYQRSRVFGLHILFPNCVILEYL